MIGNYASALRFLQLLDITPYKGTYDLAFVALSVGVAVLSMYVALSVADRIVAASARSARLVWTTVGAIVMGGGIWSMHFIGMLAFSLPCGVDYSLVLTLVSILPGVLASGVALFVLSRKDRPSQKLLFVSALLMGAGIGAMHYSGMAAMEPAALLRYDVRIVGLSVVVAVGLAYLALVIRARLKQFGGHRALRVFLPASVMGLAIAGMHYVAMEASVFYPMAGIRISGTVYSSTSLALVIGFVSVSVGLLTLGIAALVERSELTASLLAEIGRRELVQQDLLAAKEAAEAASRAKSDFLANMSHELRTPLNAIIGFSEIMRKGMFGPLNGKYAEYAGMVHDSGSHLLAIINDILDLAKAESNKLELHEEDIDIVRVIALSSTIVQELADRAGVNYDVAMVNMPPNMRGDAARLRQILINLLGNAVKFTPRGGKVSLSAQAVPGGGLEFRITDTGIGIPKDKMELAMAPFGQVGCAMARKHDGTGLGLPLTKRLVEMHGGTLDLTSEPGQGTVATVRLPAAPRAVLAMAG